MTMRSKVLSVLGMTGSILAGCSGHEPSGEGPTGSLEARIELSDVAHDVTGARLDVLPADQDCGGEALLTKTVSLEAEALPDSLAGSGTHAFADALFVVPPGSYRVCATPLAGEGPSAECGTASDVADVAAGVTTELALTSQCQGPQNGGLGVVVSLNDSPEITNVELDPSQFVSVCETLHLTATATDPNGDALTYAWSVTSGPDGSSLRATDDTAAFSGPAGDYTLAVAVDDGHGGSTSLEFPVHVSSAVCEVPAEVQAIFSTRCTPCHTPNTSGGLHLDPATGSYANLVGVHVSSSACNSRVRVIPGDSAESYIIAKLRGEAGICGLRMPRNLPPLPDEEIQTIADWIDDLPH
jgi:mono/diheme cytochrome c family protein